MAGVKRENVAKVSKGSVVRNPANPFDNPKSARIKGISGPTDAMEVLRFTAIKIMPAIRKPWLLGLLFKTGNLKWIAPEAFGGRLRELRLGD
jgi:hypothetical protein